MRFKTLKILKKMEKVVSGPRLTPRGSECVVLVQCTKTLVKIAECDNTENSVPVTISRRVRSRVCLSREAVVRELKRVTEGHSISFSASVTFSAATTAAGGKGERDASRSAFAEALNELSTGDELVEETEDLVSAQVGPGSVGSLFQVHVSGPGGALATSFTKFVSGQAASRASDEGGTERFSVEVLVVDPHPLSGNTVLLRADHRAGEEHGVMVFLDGDARVRTAPFAFDPKCAWKLVPAARAPNSYFIVSGPGSRKCGFMLYMDGDGRVHAAEHWPDPLCVWEITPCSASALRFSLVAARGSRAAGFALAASPRKQALEGRKACAADAAQKWELVALSGRRGTRRGRRARL